MEAEHAGIEAGTEGVGRQGELQQQPIGQLMAYALDLSRTYRQLRETQARLEALYLSTLAVLAAAIEARDPYLEGHSRAVESYASSIGQEMGLALEQLEALRHAALLHDIGKLGVPDSILKKAGPLDESEWRNVRQHPETGYRILSGLEFLGDALLGIRHHHERYAGHGYPAGLAGEDIPLIARILAVCDAFDAMTSSRSYRPAMELDRALWELLKGGGTQFDPRVAELFRWIVPAPGLGLRR